MKNKTKKQGFFQNLSVTILANGFGFLVSALTTFILPKALNNNYYGYWHLYLLYSGYTLYFSFGLTDGIYLRYGGSELKDVDKGLISGQFWQLVFMNFLLNLIMISYCYTTFDSPTGWHMIVFAGIAGLIAVPRSLVTLLLQATNHFTENALVVMIERIIFVAGMIFLFVKGDVSVYHFVILDVGGKLIAMLYIYSKYPSIIFSKFKPFKFTLKTSLSDMGAGIHIVLSSLSSILTLNILRQAIEANWGIETFGNVSLTISISSMFIVFVNAVAIVLFPTLRRFDNKELPQLYMKMELAFIAVIGFLLAFYYPIRIVLLYILPNKASSINYLSLLFPLFLYEGKNSLLLSTFYKVLNKQKVFLLVNVATIFICLVLTAMLKSIEIAVLSILLVQIFRAVLGEVLLSRILDFNPLKNILLEIFLTIGFLWSNNYFSGWAGSLIYLICLICYLLFQREKLKSYIVLPLKHKIKGTDCED